MRSWWGGLDRTTPTVNARAYTLLKTILNTAVADDIISANPCRIRGASTTQRLRDVRPATIPQLDIIMATLPENRRAVAALCAWCAMRIGEVLELRRKDVNLDLATVSVRRAVTWVKGIDADESFADAVARQPGSGDMATDRLLAHAKTVSGLTNRLESPGWRLAVHDQLLSCSAPTLGRDATVS